MVGPEGILGAPRAEAATAVDRFGVFSKTGQGGKFRIFFTTDLHGSDKCFFKFINAAEFYDAQMLIMGGDMTGKAVVPIVEQSGSTHFCKFFDHEYELATDSEIEDLEKLIRVNGFYPLRCTRDEYQELAENDDLRHKKFLDLMIEGVARWVGIAEDRLRGKEIPVYMTPGNDDHLEIDAALEGSDIVTNPEGRLIEIAPGVEMISCGWSGPTPFETPRECPEEELSERISVMAGKLRAPESAVFNFHDPPFDSRLDYAPALDENLTVQSEGGQPRMVPVGSRSVRELIEQYQPLMSLHGHIHESRGHVRMGRTICVNPGSEYSEGVLRGAIVDLKGSSVKNVQLISG